MASDYDYRCVDEDGRALFVHRVGAPLHGPDPDGKRHQVIMNGSQRFRVLEVTKEPNNLTGVSGVAVVEPVVQ